MWRKLPNFSMYDINEEGIIRSYHKGKNGYILKQKEDRDGYRQIGLYKDRKKYYFRVHRLVLSTFKPVKNMMYYEVNHINGIKNDNRLENLEWCTPLENTRHAIKIGHRDPRKGEDNGMSKLTKKEVLEIVKIREETGKTHREIAAEYNVARTAVTRILNGTYWSHVTGIEKESVK